MAGLHRTLSPEETEEFKAWARDNWKPGDKVSSVWHPTVVQECGIILDEYIRKNTKRYDSGTLSSNYAYRDIVAGIDLYDPEVISKEEEYELAVEHFWEVEWEEATNGQS